ICWAAAFAAGAASTSTTTPATNATLESCIGPAPAILRRIPTTGRPYTASHAGCLGCRRSSPGARTRIARRPRRTLLALSSPRSIAACTGGEAARAMADRAEERTIRLQVAGAKPQDVGRGTARLPSDALRSLGLREGDVVEVIGKRSTGIIALPPYPEDNGLQIIRLDGLERSNAGVGIGDSVEIRRAETQPARRVVLAPSQPNVRLT